MNCIVFCMNDKFVHYTRYMIEQVSRYDISTPKYVLVDDTVEQKIYDEFQYYGAKIINITKEPELIGVTSHGINGYPPIVVSKLLIPLLDVFSPYDKILYLDSDIQILRDFSSIFDIDLEGHEIGAVPDHNIRTWMSDYKVKMMDMLKEHPELHLKTEYINSGVLLINNKLLRSEDRDELVSRISSLVRIGYEVQFEYADQDMINLCFDISLIPNIYNKLYRFSQLTDHDIFLHHITHNKADLDKLIANG